MVTVSVWPKSRSLIETPENGVIVASSVVVWPATAPVITGGSFTAVATTVVVLLLLVPPAVSVAWMVKVVVTELPGATWWAVGVNTSASSAVLTAPSVPVML